MKRLAVACLVAALSGCAHFERPTYQEPAAAPVERPLPPPERVLRRAPDFKFTEFATGKIFYYRGYRESLPGGGEFRHEIVTVREPGSDVERDATNEERAFALDALEKDWRQKGLTEQIEYHRELTRLGRERRESLVDAKIIFAEKAKAHLEEELVVLEADYESSTRTPGYAAPAGHLEFLQREIAAKKAELAETRAKLEMLKYLQANRDRVYGRSSKVTPGS